MQSEPLDAVPLWLLFAAACALSGVALEAGYRLGQWRHSRSPDEKESPVGSMVASILALFAFLLAFTFGMAASRFESRREAILQEANAIGTTYLRARLLSEPQRSESMRLLREYVAVRIREVREGSIEELLRRSEEIHKSLWIEAARESERNSGPLTALYVQSLNQVIDMHGVRVQAGIRSRIPSTIWVGLFSLGLLAMASVGYQSGLSATRRSPAMIGLVLAFAGVLFLIADLDRSQEGFLSVSQQAIIDLQATMETPR